MSDDLMDRLRTISERCKHSLGFGPSKSDISALLDDAASRITYLQTEVAILMAKLGHRNEVIELSGIEFVSYSPTLTSSSSSLREEEEVKGSEPLHRDGNVIQFIPKGKP